MAPRFPTALRAALAALTTTLLFGTSLLACGAPAAEGATAQPVVTVTGQSTTITAVANGIAPFTLSLSAHGISDAATTVSTKLYAAITTRSGFLAALSSTGLSDQIDGTGAIPLSCLSAAKGSRALVVDVLTSPTTPVPAGRPCQDDAHAPSYQLDCTVSSGDCNGVYPVAVTVAAGSRVISSFVTFMTVVDGSALQPLRVATVLRVPATSPGHVAAVTRVLENAPDAAVDISLTPLQVQRLDTTPAGRQALGALGAELATTAPTRELDPAPYVSIDPGTLSASGLNTEVTRQLTRGSQVLERAGFSPWQADAGWIATSPVTEATMNALASVGISRAVIPDASLSDPTAESLTWGEPFAASPGPSSITSLAIDPILSGELSATTQPVLSAEWLLADLAFLHFERPSLTAPLGVVAVTRPGWTPSAAYLTTLFDGLANNPVVRSTTLSALFSDLTPGSNENPNERILNQTGPGTPWPAAQIRQFATERTRQSAFMSAVVGDPALVRSLTDSLLATESDRLTTTARQGALTITTKQLNDQLATIAFGGGDITLTSLKGSIPITLTKTSTYTVRGLLTLRSAHLHFPHGTVYRLVLARPTQSLRIQAVAETTGDLPFTATLTSPAGQLVLARQKVVVHTTQTSIVAIILTVGAAGVLLVWWLRTRARTGRSRHRAT